MWRGKGATLATRASAAPPWLALRRRDKPVAPDGLMDRLVRMFHGGIVKENGEFENLNEDVELFDSPPSLNDVIDRVISKHRCDHGEISLRGRFDCGKARPHYVLMKLEIEMHWRQYKEVVERANVVCWELIMDISCRTRTNDLVERVNSRLVRMDSFTQESTVSEDVRRPSPVVAPTYFDRAVASDDFDDGTFEEEEADMDEDDISLGSKGNEYDCSDEGESYNVSDTKEEELHDNVVGGQVEVDVNLVQQGDGHEQNEEEEECNDGSMPSSGNHEDGRFSYTAEEIRMLKQAHITIPTVSNAKDLSLIHRAICDSNLFENESVIDVENPHIRKGTKLPLKSCSFSWLIHSDKRKDSDTSVPSLMESIFAFSGYQDGAPNVPLLESFYDSKHRAHVIVDCGEVLQPLRPRTHTPLRWDERYAPFLRRAGLLPLARVVCAGLSVMDAALLSAFVDRWRPETHSFHLPCGEVTITMQDVAMIVGLPLEGNAFTGIIRTDGWRDMVEALIGIRPHAPPEGVKDRKTSGVSSAWLREHFNHCLVGADVVAVERHARIWIWERFLVGRLYRGAIEIFWTPYNRDELEDLHLSELCTRDAQLWRSGVPLIFFFVVELHLPHRVKRQFWRLQDFPPKPISTSQALDSIDWKKRWLRGQELQVHIASHPDSSDSEQDTDSDDTDPTYEVVGMSQMMDAPLPKQTQGEPSQENLNAMMQKDGMNQSSVQVRAGPRAVAPRTLARQNHSIMPSQLARQDFAIAPACQFNQYAPGWMILVASTGKGGATTQSYRAMIVRFGRFKCDISWLPGAGQGRRVGRRARRWAGTRACAELRLLRAWRWAGHYGRWVSSPSLLLGLLLSFSDAQRGQLARQSAEAGGDHRRGRSGGGYVLWGPAGGVDRAGLSRRCMWRGKASHGGAALAQAVRVAPLPRHM
ncbi:hypothetical protein C2845_PM13G10090 [Panicum miliaceum]|uniref:Aminotransferase-like plant mobile domain-containing protein n=1 Tax=Panicum miliaceum TaxID=4540 RepID=A0A3L6RG08_PANMI|nr:hypothetical protein C2845_PM13G10090 [Panicum miliaceum]